MNSKNNLQGTILFEVNKLLDDPFLEKNFFSQENFKLLKEFCRKAIDSANYDSLMGRYGSGIDIPQHIKDEALKKIRKITKNKNLVPAYNYLAKYQIVNGCIPNLWDHMDQNASQISLNITIEKTLDWQLIVNDIPFSLEENSAVVYSGQLHRHARPYYPSDKESDFVVQLFMQFVLPDHWAVSGDSQGFSRYAKDGDIRYFNKKKFFPLPDPPCKGCDNKYGLDGYARVLDYYQEIADFYEKENIQHLEDIDMSFDQSEEIVKGVYLYTFKEQSIKLLQGLIHNSCYARWEMAQYGTGEDFPEKTTRPSNVFIFDNQESCHPIDPLERLKGALIPALDKIVDNYSKKITIKKLIPEGKTTFLKTQIGQYMTGHTDAQPDQHRVLTVVCYFNDDYHGGEFVFLNFDVKIKPKAGQVLVFPSNFLFEHMVEPVKFGIRYSSNRFYVYDKTKSE